MPSKENSTELVCSDEFLEVLYELRRVSREAQKLAIREGNLYPVIRVLDPVVEGAHEALKLLGLGFMERRPKVGDKNPNPELTSEIVEEIPLGEQSPISGS